VPARFYCPDRPSHGVYRLKANEARHLSRVCRLGVDDEVEIFDGAGVATRARVRAVGNDWVELSALGSPILEKLPAFPLILAAAAPKADRLDWLVEKATELGVARLILVVFERSVVEPGASKIARLEQKVIEASKQCGRASLMVIESPRRWTSVSREFPDARKFLADAMGSSPLDVPEIAGGDPAVLAVGPEGGLTPAERAQTVGLGWVPVRLGVNTLRVETAAVAGVGVLFSRARERKE
jgi:16S rRNA (uracil1498-N3)-methyltransferase